MNTLLIEKKPNKPEYMATLNGVEIPLVKAIKIKSKIGQFMKVTIEVVVASTSRGEVVVKGYEYDAKFKAYSES